jgi:acetyl esterase
MTKIDQTPRLDPQMAKIVAKQAELASGFTAPLRHLPIEEARRLYREERKFWNSDAPPLARVEDAVIETTRTTPVRLYAANENVFLPVIVYLHGGGAIMGGLDTHDKVSRLLARASGCAVLAVDYGLAPEHKFPAQFEELSALLDGLPSRAESFGIDPDRLAVAGDSAGAKFALGLCLHRGAEARPPIRALALYYGTFGLMDSASMRKYGGPEVGLDAAEMAYYNACLVRSVKDLADPRLDCLNADLTGVPPCFVAAAELDPLLDDSLCLAELLEDAGVERRLEVYAGVRHSFLHFSAMLDVAGRAIEQGATFLRSQLSG